MAAIWIVGLGIGGLIFGLVADDDALPLVSALVGVALGLAFSAGRRSQQLRLHSERLEELSNEQGRLIAELRNNVLWLFHEVQRLSPSQPRAGQERSSVHESPTSVANEIAPDVAGAITVGAARAAVPQETPVTVRKGPAAAGPASVGERAPAATAANAPARPGSPPAAGPAPWSSPARALREFFLGGNTIVRVGILVLLVGVLLLLKWAADNDLFPIELRLMSAALVAMALVAVGYKSRRSRPGFAETLQGGGVAALYLTIFFAYRVYDLLPPGLAFAVLAGVSVFSCTLSALQNSMPLIILGTLGGFGAPVLASTGSGNHVALFSYYLLLDLAVLGISVFKRWRPVALLGFVCTFGIGTAWGVLRYQPEKLASTEPFLIAFFLIFASIPVWFRSRTPSDATRSDTGGHRALDSTLAFGTPLTVLLLQAALLRNEPMAMAFAVAGFAALYIGGAWLLMRRDPAHFRALFEAFLVIGAGFATLAIPYALADHNLTGAAWALEGAGMYWLGVRHQRRLRQLVGCLLQVAAGVSLLMGYWGASFDPGAALASEYLLGAGLLAVSCYLVAWTASRRREQLPGSWAIVQGVLLWGMSFWFWIGLTAVGEQLPEDLLSGGYLLFFGATCVALEMTSAKLRYPLGRWLAAAACVVTPLCVLGFLLDSGSDPLAFGWGLAWPVAFGAMLLSLKRFVPTGPSWLEHLFTLGVWSAASLIGLVALSVCTLRVGLAWAWGAAAFAVSLGGCLFALTLVSDSRWWPFCSHRQRFRAEVPLAGVLLTLLTVAVQTLGSDGNAAPLPTLPLLNPLDLAHLVALCACVSYLLVSRRWGILHAAAWYWLTALMGFVWFNGALARAVHHQVGIPFDLDALWGSPAMHWVLSGAWTLLGVVVLFLATQRHWRAVWMSAAALMAVTVAKLFLVDLSRQTTVARIVTFLAVGVALLLVGYLSPLPPKRQEATP